MIQKYCNIDKLQKLYNSECRIKIIYKVIGITIGVSIIFTGIAFLIKKLFFTKNISKINYKEKFRKKKFYK